MNSTFSSGYSTNTLPPVSNVRLAQAAAAAGHSLPLGIAATHGVRRNPPVVTAAKHVVTLSLPEKQATTLIRLGRQLFGPKGGGYSTVIRQAVKAWLNRRKSMRVLAAMAADQPDLLAPFEGQRSFSAEQVHALVVEQQTPKRGRPGHLMLVVELEAADALALLELGRTLAKEVDLATMIRVAIVEFLKRRRAA